MRKIDMAVIIKKVSIETGVSEDEIKTIYNHFILKIKYYLQLPSLPIVAISGLFSFRVDFKTIERRLKKLQHGLLIGDISADYFERVSNYFKSAYEQRYKR